MAFKFTRADFHGERMGKSSKNNRFDWKSDKKGGLPEKESREQPAL
jgi:hypothetical protein